MMYVKEIKKHFSQQLRIGRDSNEVVAQFLFAHHADLEKRRAK